MKKYIHSIIAIALLIFLIPTIGCKKFLTERPQGYLFPENVEDYELLLNNPQLYLTFPYATLYMTDGIYYPAAKTDNTPIAYAYFWNKDLDYQTNSAPAVWGQAYNSIYYTNTVLRNVLNSGGESLAKKQAVWAEAMVYRAQFYFDLLTVFAKAYNPATASTDLGVPLTTSIDMEEATPPRSSVKACFDTIINNITTAIPLLPASNINNTRITKRMANALLSRIYLYTRNYEKAIQYADEVLKPGERLMDFNAIPNYYGMMYFYPTQAMNSELVWHRFADLTIISTLFTQPSFTDEFAASFEPGDLRRKVLITDYINPGRHTLGNLNPSFGIYISEVMYNKAEALARANDGAGAMKIVNSIREKRFMTGTYAPLSAANPQEALRIVLEERKKDLLFAGTRWFDMKRLNALGEMPDVKRINPTTGEVLATLKAGSSYTFEIPKSVLMFNPNMPKNF